MPTSEVTRVLPAAREAVWQILSDMESYPQYMESVDSIKVLSRKGNEAESDWHVRLQGAPFHWVERDVFLPDEGRIARCHDAAVSNARALRRSGVSRPAGESPQGGCRGGRGPVSPNRAGWRGGRTAAG